MKREGFYLAIPHSDTCFIKDESDPFALHDGYDFSLNKRGTGRGSTGFHRFRCNDMSCEAILRVRFDVLSQWLGNTDETL